MESKFILILSVLATLIQSSFTQDKSTLYGLSVEDFDKFRELMKSNELAIVAALGTLDPVFDALEIMSVDQKRGLQSKAFDYSTLIDEALANGRTGIDRVFGSLKSIVQQCSTPAGTEAGTTPTAAYEDAENIYNTQIKGAIALASSGNFTDINTDFEQFPVATTSTLQTFMARIFDLIRLCLDTTDTTTLDAIKVHETDATRDVINTYKTVFDAIKVFAARTSTSRSVIDYYRQSATVTVKSCVLNIFAPVKGMVLAILLNKPELGSKLMGDQQVEGLSENSYGEAVDRLFGTMMKYLIKVKLGVSDGCKDDPTSLDAAQKKTAENFKTGLIALGEFIPSTDPITSLAAQEILGLFRTFTDMANGGYWDCVRLAQGKDGLTYSQSLQKIQALDDRIHAALPGFFTGISTLVTVGSALGSIGGGTSGDASAELDIILNSLRIWINDIFGACRLLAKACHGVKPVTEEDVEAMETFTNEARYMVKNYTWRASSYHVSLIKRLHRINSIVPNLPKLPKLPGLGSRFGSIIG